MLPIPHAVTSFAVRHQPCTLPLTVRPAVNAIDLRRAAALRHEAYARHVPTFADGLREPDLADADPATLVLLAESKADGRTVGTLRIQHNRWQRLPLEASVALPAWLQHRRLAEATRLGVQASALGAVARDALFKACYLYALQTGIDWLVVVARSPLDKLYQGLLFRDVFDDGRLAPMRHVGNLPHRVMALHVPEARARWAAHRHPLLGFMVEREHADIRFGAA